MAIENRKSVRPVGKIENRKSKIANRKSKIENLKSKIENLKSNSLLLGGVGGDAHSIGLGILRQALQATGYQVHYLGVQNRLEEFFKWAPFSNAVLISSMDGHARHYLRDFPELLKQYKPQWTHAPLWYLGGNIHVSNSQAYVQEFLNMGFTAVFPQFVDVITVLSILERDLSRQEARTIVALSASAEKLTDSYEQIATSLSDESIDREMFQAQREEVLQQWKTGIGAKELHNNARFISQQPSFAKAQALVEAGEQPILIQPRCGVALLSQQLNYFHRFKRFGVRVLSYQIDSLTRLSNFIGAEEELRESQKSGSSTLNGLPLINYGVNPLRRTIQAIQVPLQTRHSTRDPRLLAEISYAAGVTSFEGGPICYNIPYYKDYHLNESIRNWQYVDRLTGLYHEQFGIILDREFFGPLTGTLIPPSIAIIVTIIEAVLAIQQGVKSVSLGIAEHGNRCQDIAAIRVLKQMAQEIVQNLGYKDIQIYTVFHQYMAAFPEDYAKAEELIYNSAVTAALAGATRIISKSPVEALRIPAITDNMRGVQLAMRGVMDAAGVLIDEQRIAEEADIIRGEVEDILDSILFCGHGSFTKGVVEAFRRGFLDIPFAPSIYNQGAVMTARDVDGAIRFVSTGNLQFRRELHQFHRERIQNRLRAESLMSEKQSYILVERDVLRIPRGEYERWPLDFRFFRLEASHRF